MKFDDILVEVGEFGPYQKRVYFLTCLAPLCVSMQILAGIFIQATPDHRCALPDLPKHFRQSGPMARRYGERFHSLGQRGRHVRRSLAEVPSESDLLMYDQCKLLRTPGGLENDTVSCKKYVYDRDPFKSTFVTDTNLVCNKKSLATYASMVLMCGMLIGSLVLGILSDMFGRRKILLLSTAGHLVTSLCVPWITTFIPFVIARFFVAFFGTGMILSGFVMGMELVGPRHRRFAGNALNTFWSIGLFIEAALAYVLRDWKYLQLVIRLPSLPVLFLYVAFVPESARWLLQKGKTEEAHNILRNIAQANGYALSEKIKTLQNVDEDTRGKSFWHLFTSLALLVRSGIIIFNWLVASMVYYGLSLNSGDLSGNIYLNFVLMATAELASFLFTLFVLDITGRKKLHCSAMILGGAACIATMFPVMYGGSEFDWLTLTLSLIGKFGGTVGFAVIYVFTAELFPTVLRNSVIGVCSVSARIGGTLAPFIADMSKNVGGKLEGTLPLVIFGGASVTAGLLVLFLPETSHRILSETMEDARNFGRAPGRSKVEAASGNGSCEEENSSALLEKN